MKVSTFILNQAKNIKKLFVFNVLLYLLSFGVARLSVLIGSEMVGVVAENISVDDKLNKLLHFLVFLFLTMIGSSTLMFLTHRLETIFSIKFQNRVVKNLSSQILGHSVAFFNREMTGKIVSRFNRLINCIVRMYGFMSYFIRNFSTFLISIAIIAFMNFYLAAFYFIISLFFAAITTKYRLKYIDYSKKEAELESGATGVLTDAISNSFAVKSFANIFHERKYIFNNFKTYFRFCKGASDKRTSITYKNNLMYDVLGFLFFLAVFYTWYKVNLRIANVVFIFSSIPIIISSIKEYSYTLMALIRRYGELKDGVEFLYQQTEVVDAVNAKKLVVGKGSLSFNKVSFSYDNKKNIFTNFSLDISSKEKIGLVGRSGSGKSTFIKLLVRYYDLKKGIITIDGQDISKVTQNSLRKNISMIPQEPLLFNRTVMENIRYGNVKASDAEVMMAAEKAYCHDFIMELPNGYESKVGEKGVMLSGGERQRIAIARAILQDAPTLILDEATSALDSESEIYIQKALKDLMKKKTVIAIAHRLSTLKEMDKIVVLDKGKIVEEGTQKELLSAKGVFYNLYKMQSEGFLRVDE